MQSLRNQKTLNAVAHQGPVLPPHLPPPRPVLGALPTGLLLEIGSYITQSVHVYRLLRVNSQFYAIFYDLLYKLRVRTRQRHALITTQNMGAVHRLLANGVLDIEPEIEYLAFEESWYKFKSKMLFEAICLHSKMLFEAICLHGLSMVKLLLEAGASTAECQMDASTELLEMGKLLKQHGARVRGASSVGPIILCLLVRETQPGRNA
ncbi:hypothetical protein FN846DRAFT_888561 [Sphaerosporella brunnea]|uniref:Uncharacterized protein n=1 Tax=Sphaerosporella brunnea TaxID=1250544 RepID=A0A5J5F2J4_9PEZI|nr:hypothetical protein FN846DRAFT_888561 [Sphaerosporella brunnea]